MDIETSWIYRYWDLKQIVTTELTVNRNADIAFKYRKDIDSLIEEYKQLPSHKKIRWFTFWLELKKIRNG